MRAVGVKLGFAALKGYLGCVGSMICGCGAPCVRANVAVERPRWALVLLVCGVIAVMGATRAAAVRWKARGKAVACVPVCAHACERVASADEKRSARWKSPVAMVPEKVESSLT